MSDTTRTLREAAESALAFLNCIEWSDQSSETGAANVREELRQALAAQPSAPSVGRSDEYWLAMAALDLYPVDKERPHKSTSVVYRIHQLGHAWEAARAAGPSDSSAGE